MIYFIVNNNYQYLDFKSHLSSLNGKDVVLIEVPHSLDNYEHTGIRAVFRYHGSLQVGLMAEVLNYLSSIKRIDQDIVPAEEDVLFFYTEFEILNQYVVGRFRQAGSRVYLIEDGGFGTYVPFRMLDSEPLKVKELIKRFVYRLLPGLSRIRLHKLNGFIFPWMPDSCIDGVCLYKPVTIARTILIHFVRRPLQPQVDTIQGKVIFLNEPIYSIYQNKEEYLNGLAEIIQALCNGFSEVLFKFHPRETDDWRILIKKEVFSRYPSVIIIEEDTAIEAVIDRYRPLVAASYFCSALLSLCDRGIHPLYLYHLIPSIQKQPIFRETTLVLTELGYNFAANFAEIDSNFQSGLLGTSNFEKVTTLSDLINDK